MNWCVSGSGCSGSACGTLSSASTANGIAVTYTAPATAGLYTITATSVTDGSMSASVSVAVTDLAGVTTYHNNISRNGANTQEYALSPSSVTTSTFGKLFSCTVDGAVYAQPLWVPESHHRIRQTQRGPRRHAARQPVCLRCGLEQHSLYSAVARKSDRFGSWRQLRRDVRAVLRQRCSRRRRQSAILRRKLASPALR